LGRHGPESGRARAPGGGLWPQECLWAHPNWTRCKDLYCAVPRPVHQGAAASPVAQGRGLQRARRCRAGMTAARGCPPQRRRLCPSVAPRGRTPTGATGHKPPLSVAAPRPRDRPAPQAAPRPHALAAPPPRRGTRSFGPKSAALASAHANCAPLHSPWPSPDGLAAVQVVNLHRPAVLDRRAAHARRPVDVLTSVDTRRRRGADASLRTAPASRRAPGRAARCHVASDVVNHLWRAAPIVGGTTAFRYFAPHDKYPLSPRVAAPVRFSFSFAFFVSFHVRRPSWRGRSMPCVPLPSSPPPAPFHVWYTSLSVERHECATSPTSPSPPSTKPFGQGNSAATRTPPCPFLWSTTFGRRQPPAAVATNTPADWRPSRRRPVWACGRSGWQCQRRWW